MEYKTIRIEEKADGVVMIVLDRPEARNALSIMMRREISDALGELRDNADAKAVIFSGEGKVFCAGFDLTEFGRTDRREELFESSARYHRDLWNFPKPVVAAIGGAAMGGGFDLAVLCDIRICATGAVFAHPEIKFGGPPLFTPLRWIVGHGTARDLCLTGRKIDAAEALRIGLVSYVVEPEKLIGKAVDIAKTILQAPSETLATTKSYMTGNVDKNFEDSFAVEHDDVFRKFLAKS